MKNARHAERASNRRGGSAPAAGRISACGRYSWPSFSRRSPSIRFVNAPRSTIGLSPPRSGTGSTQANTGSTSGSPQIPLFKSRGALFCRLFGESFAVLRISTIGLALVGLATFHGLALEHGLSRRASDLLTLCVASALLVFRMSLTFMSDVPFFAAMTVAIWCYTRAVGGEHFCPGRSRPAAARRPSWSASSALRGPGPGRRLVHRSGTEASHRRLCARPVGTHAGRRLGFDTPAPATSRPHQRMRTFSATTGWVAAARWRPPVVHDLKSRGGEKWTVIETTRYSVSTRSNRKHITPCGETVCPVPICSAPSISRRQRPRSVPEGGCGDLFWARVYSIPGWSQIAFDARQIALPSLPPCRTP